MLSHKNIPISQTEGYFENPPYCFLEEPMVFHFILSLQEGESYKYLGILEADKFLEEKMKLNVSKEYIKGQEKF